MALRAILVDDEPNALESLTWELEQFPDQIQVMQTFTEADRALEFMRTQQPDCLFLDIEMPRMDGFTFIRELGERSFPVVITTAYNQYALQALKNEAIDYLLKPIDGDDLKDTLDKLTRFYKKNKISEQLEELLLEVNRSALGQKVTIQTDGRLLFLEADQIHYAESDGNYTTLFLAENQKIVLSKKLKEVNQMLPERSFFRVHNSYVVNLGQIKEYLKSDGYVILQSGKKIPVSRQKKSDFLDLI